MQKLEENRFTHRNHSAGIAHVLAVVLHLPRSNQPAVNPGHPHGIDAGRQQVSHQPLVDGAAEDHLDQRQ